MASHAAVAGRTPIGIRADVDPAEWDAYVHRHPDATGYHQHAWRRIVEDAFGHRCHYLAASETGRITGVLPLVEFQSRLFGRFAVSLPFVNYGGVIADGDRAVEALVDHAEALRRERGWEYLELRHLRRQVPRWPAREHKVAMWRPLQAGRDALFESLDRKVRNQVRKAEKNGLGAEEGGIELVGDFYRVFAHNMRDLGTPVYGRRFFEAVLRHLGDAARVTIVRAGRDAVAASVTIRWRDRVEVPWASSLRTHNDKNPNMLLYWTMLAGAAGAGAALFDFGRSTPHEGTYNFKKQWGAEPHPLVWEYPGQSGPPPDHGPTNPKFRLAISAWQKLPVAVATALGPSIVRNIP